jgi:hypothetical protein
MLSLYEDYRMNSKAADVQDTDLMVSMTHAGQRKMGCCGYFVYKKAESTDLIGIVGEVAEALEGS